MKKILPVISLILMVNLTHAQNAPDSLSGIYYLAGVHEMASAFQINNDKTFKFFFTSGALDRYATGTWKIENGIIFLTTKSKPAADFALVNSKSISGSNSTVQITEKNEALLPYVYCFLKKGQEETQAKTNNKGIASFAVNNADSITLIFEFSPERSTTVPIVNKQHNYFEFRFEPWLFEVFFKDFPLKIGNDELTGEHPLLEKNTYSYKKAE
jgi:hypothetical protein